MGKNIALSGAIPAENNDGLGLHAKDFLVEAQRRADAGMPLQLLNIVARVAVSKIVTNTENGQRYVVLRVHHWELVGDDHQQEFGQIIGDAFGARTGAQELPFPADEVPIRDPFPEEDDPDVPDETEAADEVTDELAEPRGRRSRGRS